MIKKLLLGFVLLTSVYTFAQDKKWSIEANYPISVGEEFGNDTPGIFDVGVKYRFLDANILKLGAGINTSLFRDNIKGSTSPETVDFDETNWFIQPKIFAAFKIPTLERWHPSVGLGYTFIRTKLDGEVQNEPLSNTIKDNAINLNLGISYDMTDWLFLQAQYDYLRLVDSNDDGNNLGLLKLGAGIRF